MEMSEESKVMARGTFWQNLTNVAYRLVSFVYTIAIARMVSQEEVGLFYFALGIVGVIGVYADLGLASAVQRYVPYYLGRKEGGKALDVMKYAVLLGMALVLLMTALTFFLAPNIAGFFQNPKLEPVIRLFAFHLVALQAFNIASALLVALKKIKEAAFGLGLQNIAKLAATLVLIASLGASASALTIGFVASFAIASFYLIWSLLGHIRHVEAACAGKDRAGLGIVMELVPFGISMVGVMSFGMILNYTDRMMLGYFLGQEANVQIAIYTIATGFASLIFMFSGSLIQIFFPVVSELVGKNDYKRINAASHTALRWMMFVSVPILAFIVAFGAPILRVLYGPAYEAGFLTLAFFAIGNFASLLSSPQKLALAGMRLVEIELVASAAGALLNFVLNILLIPRFGIGGAAFASMVSFALVSLILNWFAKHKFGFRLKDSIWKNIAAAVVAYLALQAVELVAYDRIVNLPFAISDGTLAGALADKLVKVALLSAFMVFGGIVYLAMLNYFRLFEKEDSQILAKILARMGLPNYARKIFARIVFWNQKEIQ